MRNVEMNKTQSCLSKEVLNRIGQDEILPDELRSIEDHVSQCAHCRDLFTAATVEPAWAETILPTLRDRNRDLSIVEEADQWAGSEVVLSLLGPTDDPRMLGRIGPYEVTGIVGRGGMGVVFKAFDAPLNRFVAIKMLLPHLASSGSARKRFSREGQAAAAVIDDHVLPIYGVDEWRGVPYIVTQYSRGISLQKRLHDQGPLELKEILRISLQVARGLAAAHAQGLVHRDVKPSNILLDRTVERALLTDFGLARAVDDATITRSGTIAGTPQFMAPEQARGEAVDGRSDLFSLGAVMYAMCTGHPPFRAESSYGVMRRITDEAARPIREINPEIPEWFCGVVDRLLQKQPADRFSSAGEVAELLEECLAHVQQPMPVPLPRHVTLQQHKSSSPSLFGRKSLVAALTVIGVLLVALAIAQRTDDADGDSDSADVAAQALPNPAETTATDSGDEQPVAADQIGTVLGKPVNSADLNENVELNEDLIRLFVRPVEEKYLKEQELDPESDLEKRIPNDAARTGALMFVRQRVLHKHLFEKRGGRVLLTAFGPIAYDAHRKWLEEREQAGDFQLSVAEHRELLFAPLKDGLQWRLTEDPDTIERAFDPATTEAFIQRMAAIPADAKRDPRLKLVGVVLDRPIYLDAQNLRDVNSLPEILYRLIIPRLEEDYRKQHPEVVPTKNEISERAAQLEQNDASVLAAYRSSLAEIEAQLAESERDSVGYRSLQARRQNLELKMKRLDYRASAEFLTGPRKFQKHLFDTYGGGRVLNTPLGPVAFDAQRKWVEERQARGEFQIADPALLKSFYDYWDARPAQTPAGRLIEDLDEAKSIFGDAVADVGAIDTKLAELPARVFHDFASGALRSDQFALLGPPNADPQVVESPHGLHIKHPGQEGYSNTSIAVQLRIHGDFDVTASFDNFAFEPSNDGSGALSITAILDNDRHTHASVQRGVLVDPLHPIRHFVQGEFVHSPQRQPGVVWLGTTPEQSTAGRLRLARVGETIHCLFAANDSSEFRLIHSEDIGPDDLLYGGIRLSTGVQSNGSEHGAASVTWKDMTIHAEQIMDWQGEIDASP